MKIAALAVIGTLAIGAATSANAGGPTVTAYLTGNSLLDYCNNERHSAFYYFCAGHIAGVSDAVTAYGGLGGYRACIPKNVPIGQVVDVVIQHLRAHPESRHLTAVSLAAEALDQAFPCR